jgi:hypothetical protein
MRATDDRYRGEQARFELAIRMIGHEARTGTIRFWTGLSDDRIRKLYASYFKFAGQPVRRRRGRSPTQIAPLVSSPIRALESGVFTNLLCANELLNADDCKPQLEHNVVLGHRFCECYETYRVLVPEPSLTFELSWNLLVSIRRGDELGVMKCEQCGVCYIVDLLALPRISCPSCVVLNDSLTKLERGKRKKPECASSQSLTWPRSSIH